MNQYKTTMNNTKQSMAKKGSLNPMHGKKQSQETKEKISSSQKARYAAIRKAIEENADILTYGKTDMKARKDLLRHLLDNNEISFKNVQQAVNFLSIMLSEEHFKSIIKEEINRFLRDNNTVCKH